MALYFLFSIAAIIGEYVVAKVGENVVGKIGDYLVDPIVDYLLAPIGRQLGYVYCLIGRLLGSLFCYNGNIEDFEKQVESLETERARVQELVHVARTNGEDVLPDVETWLTSVNKITEESRNFLHEELQVNTRFFNGRVCTNLKLRHQRSKEAKAKTTQVCELKRVGKFDSISWPKDFDSRKLILKEIMEALKDDRINMIGVYGAGGVGKTTLVEAVRKQAKGDSLFDEIVMATLSQTPNIRRIQGDIADMLDLKLEAEGEPGRARQLSARLEKKESAEGEPGRARQLSARLEKKESAEGEPGRARQLSTRLEKKESAEGEPGRARQLSARLEKKESARLEKKKRILVVLEDIWKEIKLEDIGIPFGAKHMGCKIILTSRLLDVCNQMQSQKNFSIQVLTEKEAWDLFRKMAGDSVDSADLHPLAVQIAKECAGLPIAIVTLATALKNKSLSDWRDAANQLHKSIIHSEKLFTTLELSYNYLKTDEAKSFFLLCCLFREDVNIAIEDLWKHGMGLGLFQDVDTVDEARERAYRLANDLKSSCLLLDGLNRGHVKMHDIIRDFAISIASKDKHVFLVRTGPGWKEFPRKDTFKRYTAISLKSNDIHELPDELQCPQLELLFLECPHPSLQFPNSFFLRMENVKVLNMSGMHFLSLPLSLRYLKNLRTLCLDRCKLKDLSLIGELEKLEILSFLKSSMKELPNEIGMLTHLRLLDLSRCKDLTIIPPDVVRRLSQLEGLYMAGGFHKWEIERLDEQRRNASLAELRYLFRLINLEIDIPDSTLWPEDLLFQNLSRFQISIGDFRSDQREDYSYYPYSKSLRLKVNLSTPLQDGVKVLLKVAEDLQLTKMKGLKNVHFDLDTEGFRHLRCLHVKKCDEVEYIFNASQWGVSHDAFPMLEKLNLHRLRNLKEICHDQHPIGLSCQHVCFRNLSIVKVFGCKRLKILFSHSIVRDLSKLVKLRVKSCKIMEQIFGNENEGGAAAAMDDIEFPHLRSLKLLQLPELKNFCSAFKDDPDEQFLFEKKVALPALEKLEILGGGNFKEIWHPQFSVTSFSQLKILKVANCNKLLNVIPFNLLQSLRSLEKLCVARCDSVEEIIEVGRLGVEEGNASAVLSQLRFLVLGKLPKLEHLWWDFRHGALGCRNLTSIHIFECNSLKSVFLHSIASSLVQLQTLKIVSCQMMETIIAKDRDGDVEIIVFPQLRTLVLKNLPKLMGFYTGRCTSNFTSLKDGRPAMKTFTSSISQKHETNDEALDESTEEGDLCISIQPLFDDKVTFPILDELQIIGLDNLKDIWHPQLPTESFRQLRFLVVERCHKLVNVVPSNLLKVLKNLEIVLVEKCDSVEIIFEIDAAEDRHGTRIFSQLRKLQLIALPKLFTSRHPLLQKPQMNNEEFEEKHGEDNSSIVVQPLFDKSVALTKLAALWILEIENLQEIFHSQISDESLCQLEFLQVRGCPKLSRVAPSNLLPRLKKLESLTVQSCASMKEIFELEGLAGEGHISLFQLRYVEFFSLPNLGIFCKGNYNFELPSLKRLILVRCPKMQTFSSGSIITPKLNSIEITLKDREKRWKGSLNRTIEHLFQEKVALLTSEELEILDGENLSEFWHTQFSAMSFSRLKILEVANCNDVLHVVPFNLLQKLCNLEDLCVSCCDSVEEIIEIGRLDDGEGHVNAALSLLRFLQLEELPKLKHIWWHYPQGKLGFRNLSSIRIFECNRLKSVFSPSIANSLVLLQKLDIDSCKMMETIIADEREGEENSVEVVVLPQLSTLLLKNLPKLVGFYTGRCTSNFPSLKDGGPATKTFNSSIPQKHETNDEALEESPEEGDLCNSIQPLFDSKATFPILEELEISGLDNLKDIWHSQLPTESFCQLRVLIVKCCHKLVNVVPSNLLKVLKNLEAVGVIDCDLVEIIFEIDAAEDRHGTSTLSRLRQLQLEGLPKLFTSKHPLLQNLTVNNEEFKEKAGEGNSSIPIQPLFNKSVALTKLEYLWILEIENLQEIFPSQLLGESFCQLQFLQLRGCPKLSRVAPSNLLPRLKKLKDLYVEECDSMKEIFELEGLVGEGHISLFQLRHVQFLDLPNLRIFCSGNYNFEMPSLERLILQQCPKMWTFSFGSISAPKLDSIELMINDREKRWEGSLNRTIEQLFQEKEEEEEECRQFLISLFQEEEEENISAQEIQHEIP